MNHSPVRYHSPEGTAGSTKLPGCDVDHRLFIYRVLSKSFNTVVILPHCRNQASLIDQCPVTWAGPISARAAVMRITVTNQNLV